MDSLPSVGRLSLEGGGSGRGLESRAERGQCIPLGIVISTIAAVFETCASETADRMVSSYFSPGISRPMVNERSEVLIWNGNWFLIPFSALKIAFVDLSRSVFQRMPNLDPGLSPYARSLNFLLAVCVCLLYFGPRPLCVFCHSLPLECNGGIGALCLLLSPSLSVISITVTDAVH